MTPTNKPSPECVRAAEEIIEVLPNIIPVGIEAEKLCDTLAHIIARETRVNEMREALQNIADWGSDEGKLVGLSPMNICEYARQAICITALGEGGGK